MAWIVVQNATVESVFFNGKGAKVTESFTKRDNTEGKAYYSAFFEEPHNLQVGDVGKFSGVLGLKPEIYNEKAQANPTINNARVEDLILGEGEQEEPGF